MPDDPDDEGILDPNDLDIDDDDRVRSLDEGRYVVEPGDDATASPSPTEHAVDPDATVPLPDGAFALTARARAEDRTDSLRVDSDDVVASFEALVRWYAALVAPDDPPAAVVATLLRHASLDVAASAEKEDEAA
jgi:hypothetical protein